MKEHDDLDALATDAAGELDILGHDSNALGMESNKMRLTSFLQCEDRKTLESDITPHVLSNLHH